MEAQQEKARHLVPFTPPGRIASIILRYTNYQEFYETAKLLQTLLGSTSPLPPSDNPTYEKRVYRTPIGSGPATVELRLICHDSSSAKQADVRRKKQISTYYQVGAQLYPTPAAAKKALTDAAVAVHQDNLNLTILGGIEQDEDASLVRVGTQRVILADGDGDNQVCMLVNPPFPRTGDNDFLRKLPTLLAITAGIGALLLGTLSLLRRR